MESTNRYLLVNPIDGHIQAITLAPTSQQDCESVKQNHHLLLVHFPDVQAIYLEDTQGKRWLLNQVSGEWTC